MTEIESITKRGRFKEMEIWTQSKRAVLIYYPVLVNARVGSFPTSILFQTTDFSPGLMGYNHDYPRIFCDSHTEMLHKKLYDASH
jgi:hypothetical protein